MLAFLAWTAGACADFQSPEDPTGGWPDVAIAAPTFAGDIAPMLEARCATGGCHSTASHRAELTLTSDVSYDALVGVPARLNPGMLLVEPGDAANSWLVRMIVPDAEARGGLSRMPLASTPLTAHQIDNIRRWIDQGAAPD